MPDTKEAIIVEERFLIAAYRGMLAVSERERLMVRDYLVIYSDNIPNAVFGVFTAMGIVWEMEECAPQVVFDNCLAMKALCEGKSHSYPLLELYYDHPLNEGVKQLHDESTTVVDFMEKVLNNPETVMSDKEDN